MKRRMSPYTKNDYNEDGNPFEILLTSDRK